MNFFIRKYGINYVSQIKTLMLEIQNFIKNIWLTRNDELKV